MIPTLSFHWLAQEQTWLHGGAGAGSSQGQHIKKSMSKQTVTGDRELDLRLDLPKLILGFADVDGLVIQRGTWNMARRMSPVGLKSPE